jgi:hypothetical protein
MARRITVGSVVLAVAACKGDAPRPKVTIDLMCWSLQSEIELAEKHVASWGKDTASQCKLLYEGAIRASAFAMGISRGLDHLDVDPANMTEAKNVLAVFSGATNKWLRDVEKCDAADAVQRVTQQIATTKTELAEVCKQHGAQK